MGEAAHHEAAPRFLIEGLWYPRAGLRLSS